jgi:hypothetical protein
MLSGNKCRQKIFKNKGSFYKFKILSETRREKNFSAPHMFDMQAIKFIEQRRIATEFGFIEVP